MKRIAILGANGQLGSDLVSASGNYSNFDVLPLVRNDIDVEKPDFMERLKMYKTVDAIINCISYHKTDECEEYPEKTFHVNSLFLSYLSRFCAENDIILFQISSDYVFDGGQNRPYRENDHIYPLNVYGASKAVSEFFVRQYTPRHFILRVSSLFGTAGASGKGGNFVETMLRLAEDGKPIKVINDQFMSPTHTADVARTAMEIIDKDISEYGIYHCNNTGSCSWYEFTRKIFELCDIDADLNKTTYNEYKTRAMRPRYSVMDNDKISKIHVMPDWQDALKTYLLSKGHLTMAVK